MLSHRVFMCSLQLSLSYPSLSLTPLSLSYPSLSYPLSLSYPPSLSLFSVCVCSNKISECECSSHATIFRRAKFKAHFNNVRRLSAHLYQQLEFLIRIPEVSTWNLELCTTIPIEAHVSLLSSSRRILQLNLNTAFLSFLLLPTSCSVNWRWFPAQ